MNLKVKYLQTDELNMTTFKHIIPAVIEAFTYICNLSFTSGSVPNSIQIANIIPLFKAGGKNSFTNYRPVALLPQFPKILEKLFCKQLYDLKKYIFTIQISIWL